MTTLITSPRRPPSPGATPRPTAKKEVTNSTRIVTSVHVTGGEIVMVSVKTHEDIPKGEIFDIMREICVVTVPAPVKIGDVIIADCAGTGVPVEATKNVAAV